MTGRALPRPERAGLGWAAEHCYRDRATDVPLLWTPRTSACSFCIIENTPSFYRDISEVFDIDSVFYRVERWPLSQSEAILL